MMEFGRSADAISAGGPILVLVAARWVLDNMPRAGGRAGRGKPRGNIPRRALLARDCERRQSGAPAVSDDRSHSARVGAARRREQPRRSWRDRLTAVHPANDRG